MPPAFTLYFQTNQIIVPVWHSSDMALCMEVMHLTLECLSCQSDLWKINFTSLLSQKSLWKPSTPSVTIKLVGTLFVSVQKLQILPSEKRTFVLICLLKLGSFGQHLVNSSPVLTFEQCKLTVTMTFLQKCHHIPTIDIPWLAQQSWGGWDCEVSCGGHHRLRGKTTAGSALDEAVFDIAQILAYLVHDMNRSQLLGVWPFWPTPFFFLSIILVGLWLNSISSVEITL